MFEQLRYDRDAIHHSDGMLRRENGRLLVEDIEVNDLVAAHGSPLYVISEKALRERARRIQRAFEQEWPGGPVTILASVKANPITAIHRLLAQEGFGADLVNEGEFELAMRAGADPQRISVNGPGKDYATIERAVSVGARITVDAVREIELARRAAEKLGRKAELRMRLRPYVESSATVTGTDHGVSEAYTTYKSGIPVDDLRLAAAAANDPLIDMSGIMMHFPRFTLDLDVVGRFSERFGEMIGEFSELCGNGWTPRTIDLGGGMAAAVDVFGRYGTDYVDGPPPPPIEEHARALCQGLIRGLVRAGISPEGRTLEVEPGRSLFGTCGIHATTVLNVKHQSSPVPYEWIETDTSINLLSDIRQSASRPPVIPAVLEADGPDSLVVADIVGRSCQQDVIIPDAVIARPTEGDVLALCFTAAYQEAGASNYNLIARPATVLVNGSEAQVIRRRESVEDVLRRDLIPEHLNLAPSMASSTNRDEI